MHRDITHSCGHIEQHIVVGFFAADADNKAMALSRRKCATCYRAGKEASAEAQAVKDRDALTGINFPALTGSEKQVAWAGKIRLERLSLVQRKHPEAVAAIAMIVEAKWWIDNRTVTPDRLARHILTS